MLAMTTEVFLRSVLLGLILGGIIPCGLALHDQYQEHVEPRIYAWIHRKMDESATRNLVEAGLSEEKARETVAGWRAEREREQMGL